MEGELKDRQIIFDRIIDAPVELVFETWKSADHLDNWWGPNNFITITEEINFEVDGYWKYEMRHEDHGVFPNLIKYLEILENKKIVFDHGTEEGVPPQHRTTVIFEKLDGKTRVCFTLEFSTKEACDKVKKFGVKGGQETLEKLENYAKEIKDEN